MRVPEALWPLLDQGVIEEVIRPLMSGKEADVFLVVANGERRVAKLYKESIHRSFKHRAQYTEGRKVRNSREQRAMAKRTKFGREQMEAAWRTAEVDIIYRLDAAGVRVPEPIAFVEGVLVMELIQGPDGEPAPRLVDVEFSEDDAYDVFHRILGEVVKMLCAGVVHGDLSDFNVLLSHEGPVIIDFPQAVDAAHNRNARELLVRDVDNLTRFLARYATKLRRTAYGEEMWALYEANQLTPETRLTGKKPRRAATTAASTLSLLEEIEQIQRESAKKREALGLPPRRPARAPRQDEPSRPSEPGSRRGEKQDRQRGQPSRPAPEAEAEAGSKKKRRRRRRGRKGGEPSESARQERPRDPPDADDDAFEASDDLDAFLLVED